MALQSTLQPHPYRTVWPAGKTVKCDDCGALEADPRHNFRQITLTAAAASSAGLLRFPPRIAAWHGFAGQVFAEPSLHAELAARDMFEYVLELAGSVRDGTSPYTLRTIGWSFGRHSKFGRDLHLRLHGDVDGPHAIWTLTGALELGAYLDGVAAKRAAARGAKPA